MYLYGFVARCCVQFTDRISVIISREQVRVVNIPCHLRNEDSPVSMTSINKHTEPQYATDVFFMICRIDTSSDLVS